MGLLRYRAMLDPGHWKEAFFVLQRSNLFICPRTDGAAEDIINLNRLQELSQYLPTANSASLAASRWVRLTCQSVCLKVSPQRQRTTRRGTS